MTCHGLAVTLLGWFTYHFIDLFDHSFKKNTSTQRAGRDGAGRASTNEGMKILRVQGGSITGKLNREIKEVGANNR
jgi:hypothetical protein